MEKTFKEVWQPYKKNVANHKYSGVDFDGTDFNAAIFENVDFDGCVFRNCKLDHTRIYACNFSNCKFIGLDLNGVMFGSHGGEYIKCVFDKCSLRRGRFYYPEFVETSFLNCRLAGIDWLASYFEKCKFSGRLSNITFKSSHPDNDSIAKPRKKNLFVSIDFSEAVFGDFVTFVGCDLSHSQPPAGKKFSELLHLLPVKFFGENKLSTGDKDF